MPCGIEWTDATREQAFGQWLAATSDAHGLLPHTVRLASADASFRRYFRVDRASGGSCIVMDAPRPGKLPTFCASSRADERSRSARTRRTGLGRAPGLHVAERLGSRTLLDVLDFDWPQDNLPHFKDATAALTAWQTASRPDVLPAYDEAPAAARAATLPRLVPGKHKQFALTDTQANVLAKVGLHQHRHPQPRLGPKVFRAPRFHAAQPDGAPRWLRAP